LNYKELTTKIPAVAFGNEVLLIGGFYYGNTHLVFLKESKFNRTFRFPTSTITALAYHEEYHHLFVGDSEGYLKVFHVQISSRQI